MLSPQVHSEETKHETHRVLVFASRCQSATQAYRAATGPRALLEDWVGQGEAIVLRGEPAEIVRAARVAPRAQLSPRFVGGFAFDLSRAPAAPWQGFPVGHFACPRLQWFANGGTPQVVIVAGAHESRADVTAEFEAFEARALRDASAGASLVHATLAASTASTTVIGEGDRAAWTALVERAVVAFETTGLQKVVAAREVDAESSAPFDCASLLEALEGTPASRFAIDVAGATFLGASPELLVEKRGARVFTEALAGSEPRRGGHDAEEIARLTASEKDHDEHRFVVDAIESALRPFVSELRVPVEAEVRTLPTVHHLQRPIEGTLGKDAHVLDLVAAMHPTPAVCGTPREAAFVWLREHERLERGYYAGPVGWFDAHGDGEFHVALRSALVRGNRAWLYAGAGLVRGSEPAREFAEVEAKLRVMKSVLAPGGAVR